MIVFDLICGVEHRFEGWFSSNDDLDRQRERGLLTCPVCGNANVAKLPGSKIKRADANRAPDRAEHPVEPVAEATRAPAILEQMQRHAEMAAFLAHVIRSTEDVGTQFAEEARKIHYKESPERAIRGRASIEETRELLEEGIPLLPLPIPPQSDIH